MGSVWRIRPGWLAGTRWPAVESSKGGMAVDSQSAHLVPPLAGARPGLTGAGRPAKGGAALAAFKVGPDPQLAASPGSAFSLCPCCLESWPSRQIAQRPTLLGARFKQSEHGQMGSCRSMGERGSPFVLLHGARRARGSLSSSSAQAADDRARPSHTRPPPIDGRPSLDGDPPPVPACAGAERDCRARPSQPAACRVAPDPPRSQTRAPPQRASSLSRVRCACGINQARPLEGLFSCEVSVVVVLPALGRE